ncbi:hypothetical protein C6500_10390 [Candidatus Poribacteria bacterium]|nr:MAG: hypothetical protein C6500_10390 [Candidatus Poribacteria bacterium]
MEFLGIWIAAFLTLCIYSFLYRDNPFYRFAEHLLVGMSVGYLIVLNIYLGFIPYAWNPIKKAVTGEASPLGFLTLIPVCLGLLFFARLSPRHGWLLRYPIAILMAITSGIQIPNVLQTDIFAQVYGTLIPFSGIGTLNAFEIFGAILMVIGVVCTLTYFFFSVEHTGAVGGLSKVGIAFLMIGFGSAFGNTVMGRVALLIQRVDFLLNDWLGTIF